MIPYSLQVPPQARALTPFRPRRYVCMCCQAPHKPTGLQVLCVGCITCIWCSLALVCSLGAISGIWPWFAVGAGRLRGLRFAVQSATGLQFAVYGDMGQGSGPLPRRRPGTRANASSRREGRRTRSRTAATLCAGHLQGCHSFDTTEAWNGGGNNRPKVVALLWAVVPGI